MLLKMKLYSQRDDSKFPRSEENVHSENKNLFRIFKFKTTVHRISITSLHPALESIPDISLITLVINSLGLRTKIRVLAPFHTGQPFVMNEPLTRKLVAKLHASTWQGRV